MVSSECEGESRRGPSFDERDGGVVLRLTVTFFERRKREEVNEMFGIDGAR